MPDSITIIVSAICTIIGAGLAVMALKSRSERKLHSRETEIAALRAKGAVLAERQQELAAQNKQLQADLSAKNNEFASLQGRMAEAQASFGAREKLLRESNERMKVEFESLATKVLNAQGAQQRQSLDVMLNPFREQIGDFRKRVEEVYRSDTKERASLLKEIKFAVCR